MPEDITFAELAENLREFLRECIVEKDLHARST